MKRPCSLLILVWLIVQGSTVTSSSQSLRREEEEDDPEIWFEDDYRINGFRPEYRIPSGGIIGGTDATGGEYSWFVSLESNGQIYCGGTLISANKVLSAAHCFFRPGSQTVTLPTRIRVNHIGTTDGETVGVKCVSIHPGYRSDALGLFDDVAVLTLSSSVTSVTSFVTLNANTGYPTDSGQELTVIGFGRTSPGGAGSSTLKKATENFVTEVNCKNSWSCVSSAYHVCAAQRNDVGVCQGDSGGPLLDAKKVQVGVTSFGDTNCGDPPDVFANVAQYNSWIVGELTSGTCTSTHTPGPSPCQFGTIFCLILRRTSDAIGAFISKMGFQ